MPPDDTTRRRHLLTAALVGALLPADVPHDAGLAGQLVGNRPCDDSIARQDYDLQLTRYGDRRWRATFFLAGPEHSFTGDCASAYDSRPWRAVQRAALGALGRIPE